MKKVLIFSTMFLFVFLLFSGCVQQFLSQEYPASLEVYVTDYRSGAAVEEATVTVFDESGSKVAEKVTDGKGFVKFDLKMNDTVKYFDVKIEKENYGITRLNNYMISGLETKKLELTLRKTAYDTSKASDKITINASFFEDEGMSKTLNLTKFNLNKFSGDELYYKINVLSGTGYDVNHVYVKVGGVPGSGFFTNPRNIYYDTEIEGSISLDGFSGKVPVFVAVFDQNENLVVNAYYLTLVKESGDYNMYVVEKPSDSGSVNLKAYTRRAGIKFYSNDIQKSAVSEMKFEKPNAAPDKDLNMWIEVNWVKWEDSSASSTTDKPEAYVVYRSFDGVNYELIARVPSDTNYYRDSSAQLEAGKEVWYKVGSYYSGKISSLTDLGSVVPLGMFDIKYISPTDGATDVSTNPTFEWEVVNPIESPEGSAIYYYDIWLYDETLNDYGYYSLSASGYPKYNFIGTVATSVSFAFDNPPAGLWWVDYGARGWYQFNTLQKNKTYEWGNELAVAIVSDEDSEAYSIYADQGKIIDPFGIEAEIYNTFTTGEN